MITRIARIGNTLTVEIPEELAAEAELRDGEAVEWVSNGSGSLALVRTTLSDQSRPRKRMTLEELLAGIPENADMEEIDWGPPRGAEIW